MPNPKAAFEKVTEVQIAPKQPAPLIRVEHGKKVGRDQCGAYLVPEGETATIIVEFSDGRRDTLGPVTSSPQAGFNFGVSLRLRIDDTCTRKDFAPRKVEEPA